LFKKSKLEAFKNGINRQESMILEPLVSLNNSRFDDDRRSGHKLSILKLIYYSLVLVYALNFKKLAKFRNKFRLKFKRDIQKPQRKIVKTAGIIDNF
jgi:hypothetical protein